MGFFKKIGGVIAGAAKDVGSVFADGAKKTGAVIEGGANEVNKFAASDAGAWLTPYLSASYALAGDDAALGSLASTWGVAARPWIESTTGGLGTILYDAALGAVLPSPAPPAPTDPGGGGGSSGGTPFYQPPTVQPVRAGFLSYLPYVAAVVAALILWLALRPRRAR